MKKASILILLAIIGVIGFIVISGKSAPILPSSLTQTPTPTTEVIPMPTIDNSELKQGGSSLSDSAGVYSVLYPSDYRFDSQNEGTVMRIYKSGPTQKGQTEMHDGVILTFERIELGGLSLSEWLDEQIKQAVADGTSQVVEPKQPVLFNNTYPGFTYVLQGLGLFGGTVIQKDVDSPYAVRITTLVADPESVGFQKEVDMILSTVELHK